MELLDALQWRYAVKEFSKAKVSPAELRVLMNSARLSASSYGLQPYNILVIESATTKKNYYHFHITKTKFPTTRI